MKAFLHRNTRRPKARCRQRSERTALAGPAARQRPDIWDRIPAGPRAARLDTSRGCYGWEQYGAGDGGKEKCLELPTRRSVTGPASAHQSAPLAAIGARNPGVSTRLACREFIESQAGQSVVYQVGSTVIVGVGDGMACNGR